MGHGSNTTRASRDLAVRKIEVEFRGGPHDGSRVRIPFSWLNCGITFNAYGLAAPFTAEYRRAWQNEGDRIVFQWCGSECRDATEM